MIADHKQVASLKLTRQSHRLKRWPHSRTATRTRLVLLALSLECCLRLVRRVIGYSIQSLALEFTEIYLVLGSHKQPKLGPPAALVVTLLEEANLIARHGLGKGLAALVIGKVPNESACLDVHEYIPRLQQIRDNAPSKEDNDTSWVENALLLVKLLRRNRITRTAPFH